MKSWVKTHENHIGLNQRFNLNWGHAILSIQKLNLVQEMDGFIIKSQQLF